MTKEETIEYYKKALLSGKKKLLLHACCGPCTSGVYEQVSPYFDVTVYYYNPNIYPKNEYELRLENLNVLNNHFPFKLVSESYDENEFLNLVKGHEKDKEGGERCSLCFRMRLKKAAIYAKEKGFDCFTSTLSVSPYKNAELLNKIGNEIEEEVGISYLYSDFKKHDGYLNSIKNSKTFGLYRQDYCGCRCSKHEEILH